MIFDDICPDTIVARGVGIKAKELTFGTGNLLIDISPLSIGIEVLGGYFEPIIKKNTQIPCSAKEIFSTSVDGQKSVSIRVFQGDRPFVRDCRLIDIFKFDEIPPMRARESQIEVNFRIDADGLLGISAIEKKSGISKIFEVRLMHDVSLDEILKAKKDATDNQKNDVENLNLRLADDRLLDLILFVNRAIELECNVFEDQKKFIFSEIERLKSETKNGDINKEIDGFEEFLKPFFEKMASSAFMKSLKN